MGREGLGRGEGGAVWARGEGGKGVGVRQWKGKGGATSSLTKPSPQKKTLWGWCREGAPARRERKSWGAKTGTIPGEDGHRLSFRMH